MDSTPTVERRRFRLAGIADRLDDLDLATYEELDDHLPDGAASVFDTIRAHDDAARALAAWNEDPVGPRPKLPKLGKALRALVFIAGRLEQGPSFSWADAGAVRLTDVDLTPPAREETGEDPTGGGSSDADAA